MMRLAGLLLVAVVAAFPLGARPAAPVTWLAAAAFVIGAAGVIVRSVSLVTAGASLALLTYALALLIAGPTADPLTSVVFGATLVLLPALVHAAGRADGAALGPAVLASQARQWLMVVLVGAIAAGMLTLGATALGPMLREATLPLVVVIAVLGAALTATGIVALTTGGDADAREGRRIP